MAANTWDEYFVQYMANLPDVTTLCNKRVYHMEVFQNANSISLFPCVVYQLQSDQPEKELSNNPPTYYARYEVRVISEKSGDIKTLAKAIAYLGSNEFDVTVQTDLANSDTGIYNIIVDDDVEQDDFAQQLQEKGYKSSILQVQVWHLRK